MLPANSSVRDIGLRVQELTAEYGDVDVVASQVLIALSASEKAALVEYCIARFVAEALDDRSDGPWR